jgi:hypothetical protein
MRRLLRGLIPLSVLAIAWVGFWLSGYGVLIARVETTVEMESTIECDYLHATGRRVVIEFTTDPRSITCAGYVRLPSATTK